MLQLCLKKKPLLEELQYQDISSPPAPTPPPTVDPDVICIKIARWILDSQMKSRDDSDVTEEHWNG